MASSQVEVPSSSQRFEFILRDRNQNAVVFNKSLKPPLKHHHQLFKHHVSDENSENFVHSWIENHGNKNRVRLTEKPIFKTSPVLADPVESQKNENLGASSLVQIWEARLHRSNGGNSPSYSPSTASGNRSDSEISVHDSLLSIDGDSEFADESEITGAKNHDRTVEIESESHGSVSDSGESKWGRVADLIHRLSNEDKKLTAGDNGGCGGNGLSIIITPRLCISSCSSSSEKNDFPVVKFSPRIRGRQAFTDLLMKMERERHRELDLLLERNAVSRFTQRGRIQSMLRLRSLKRCLAIQDQNRSNTKPVGLNRIESGSAVMQLREKFRANAVNAAAAADQRKERHRSTEINNKNVVETEGATKSSRLKNDDVTVETFFTERLSLRNHNIEEAAICKEEETVNGTVGLKTNCLQLQETREEEQTCNRPACNDSESEKKEEEKTSSCASLTQEPQLRQNQNESKFENFEHEIEETEGVVHENNEMDQCLEQQGTSYLNGWEEQEEYEDEQFYYGETNNDWLSEISRPRSYWEELRKSRYLEVLNTRSEKEDICRLLERRTVTDFLESGLREKIDNLMMSRVQTHSSKISETWELQQEEEEKKNEIEEVEEEELLTEDDRDDSSRSSSSQMFAPSPAGSWSSQDTQVTSTPLLSVHSPHSPEMELISDMRLQIQQLQQEMSVLRDSVKTCLDANASLQQSVQQENPLKRKCCACDESQVEAVLYRCGHMCMCLKCANELHCSGGKCPICRDQIVDVVRVFFDTRN